MRIPKYVRVILKTIVVLILIPVFGIAIALGLLWVDHNRDTTLPAPTGPFAVGRSTYVWKDAAHADAMAPQPGISRELLAWIWYPAAPRQTSQASEDYLPAAWGTALERHSGVMKYLSRDLARVHTHSVRDAEVSPQQRAYPVVMMRAGLAKMTTDYTTLAEDLASRGYVVVGFDAPYRTTMVVFPDGRVIARAPQNDADLVGGIQQEQLATRLLQAWTADMSFALDELEQLNAETSGLSTRGLSTSGPRPTSGSSNRLAGRLDLERVGVFGHSLGGATALQFCHDDCRCQAGIDIDGAPLGSVVRDGVQQPFLFLLSDHTGEPDAEARPILAKFRSIYERLPADRRLYLVLRGGGHYLFSDDTRPLLMNTMHKLGVVHIDARRQGAITAHLISTFFDVYLKGAPASTLKTQPDYPEIKFIP